MSKGKEFRLTLPLTPRPPARPRTPDYTDSDESGSVLSQTLKRKLPSLEQTAGEEARQSTSPSSSEQSEAEETRESTSRRKKPVSG